MAPSSFLRRLLPWARDFSIVGAACGFLAPFAALVGQQPRYALATSLGGMAAGAALGPLSGAFLWPVRRHLPKIVVSPFGLVLGALWGGLAGLAPELLGHGDFWYYSRELSVCTSAVAGAALGWWFWLAYSYRLLNHRSTSPAVLAGCGAAPSLGFVAYYSVNAGHSPHQAAVAVVLAFSLLVVPWGLVVGWLLVRSR